VAEDLEHYPRWQPCLHRLGEIEVKHGDRISVVNFYQDEIGNPAVPQKFRTVEGAVPAAGLSTQASPGLCLRRWIIGGLIGTAAVFVALALIKHQRKSATTSPQTVSAARIEASASAAISQKSIAVLPFVNMSADKGDEYLSDGMTEELLNALTKVKGLRVPGRSSSFAFKGKNEEDIFRKVGDQLHVGTVLEGSVRTSGDKLRVTAQLINVADGYHLWSETYDRDLKDILAVESEVAQRVVEALQVKLGVEEVRHLSKKVTTNPEAHRLYLLGRYNAAKYTQTDVASAVRYYEQALQLDPGFALAYCGLADAYGLMGGNTMSGREAWAKEKSLARKALELDPDLAEAHLSLGIALAGSYDWEGGAENEIKRALELNPKLALAHDASAWVFTATGRFDEAIAVEKKGLELDPLNPFLNDGLAWYLYMARRYDEAISQLQSSMELFPNDAFSHQVLGWCLIRKGNATEATAEFQKATELDDLPWYIGAFAYGNAVTGDRAKGEQILHDLEELAKRRYVAPGARVTVYLGLGEKEKALEWLEKCYQDQDGACWWMKVDPLYDGLRNEPRFQAILKKVGLDQ
jgi:serine/threonine-protein kinase